MPGNTSAEENASPLSFDEENLTIVFRPGSFEQKKLSDSLKSGFTAAISYKIKVYTKNTQKIRLFGETLLLERDILYTGRLDSFSDTYTVEDNGAGISTAGDFQQFMSIFLRCSISGIVKEIGCGEDTFFLYRVQLDYIDLHPPLNLLSLFLLSNRYTSSWERIDCSELSPSPGQSP